LLGLVTLDGMGYDEMHELTDLMYDISNKQNLNPMQISSRRRDWFQSQKQHLRNVGEIK